VKVLVTGSGPGGYGEQITKALTGITLAKYTVFTADANPRLAMNRNGSSHTLPLASSPEYIPDLISLCKRLGIEALLPGSEPELIEVSRHLELFENEGIFVAINRPELIELCSDKAELAEELALIGFPGPRSMVFGEESSSIDESWFPIVVKPQLGGRGSKDVFICQTKEELDSIVVYLTKSNPNNMLLIQEYVGSHLEEYTVGVLHDSAGTFLGSAVMNRELNSTLSVRQSVPNLTSKHELGELLVVSSGVSQGFLAQFQPVADQCRQIAEALNSRGPLNLQLRLVEGKAIIFEINPRFSGTTSSRALAGFNEPDVLLQRELGGIVFDSPIHPQPGQVTRSLQETFISEGGLPI
jgi:carbamoyl-phosphate synthase large subunit